jgi:hypothetical protein
MSSTRRPGLCRPLAWATQAPAHLRPQEGRRQVGDRGTAASPGRHAPRDPGAWRETLDKYVSGTWAKSPLSGACPDGETGEGPSREFAPDYLRHPCRHRPWAADITGRVLRLRLEDGPAGLISTSNHARPKSACPPRRPAGWALVRLWPGVYRFYSAPRTPRPPRGRPAAATPVFQSSGHVRCARMTPGR